MNQPLPKMNVPVEEAGMHGHILSVGLRGLGALVVIVAFVLYLFEGWTHGSELTRMLMLVGHTLLLTLAGFFLGHWLHEPKGARLLIALALAAMPVDFILLGSISYPLLAMHAIEPRIASAVTGMPTIPLVGAAVLLLAFSVYVGFLVMARRSALRLAGVYLMANAALLVPTRDETVISIIMLAVGALALWFIVQIRRRDTTLATGEGLFARLVLLLPLLVIGGRTVWAHAPDLLFYTTVAFIAYLSLRQLRGQMAAGSWADLIDVFAATVAMATALGVASIIESTGGVVGELFLPIAGITVASMLFDLSLISPENAKTHRRAGLLAMIAACLASLYINGGMLQTILTLVVSVSAMLFGFLARDKWVFGAAIAGILCAVWLLIDDAVANFSIGGWSGLVVLGGAIIFAGSMIERYGDGLRATLVARFKEPQ